MANRKDALRFLCSHYLERLDYMAKKHGLGKWLHDIKLSSKHGECEPTEKEVEMLSRLCDDERVSRADIPKILGKSYRQANEDGDFCRIKKLKHQGIYSKLSVLLYKSKYGHKRKNKVS